MNEQFLSHAWIDLTDKISQMKRRSILITFAILFAINAITFSQTKEVAPSADTSFRDIAAIVGIATGVVTAFMFIVTMIWFIVQGKNREQLKEQAEGWKDTCERLREELKDKEIAEVRKDAHIHELEKAGDLLRKANLRLQNLPDDI